MRALNEALLAQNVSAQSYYQPANSVAITVSLPAPSCSPLSALGLSLHIISLSCQGSVDPNLFGAAMPYGSDSRRFDQLGVSLYSSPARFILPSRFFSLTLRFFHSFNIVCLTELWPGSGFCVSPLIPVNKEKSSKFERTKFSYNRRPFVRTSIRFWILLFGLDLFLSIFCSSHHNYPFPHFSDHFLVYSFLFSKSVTNIVVTDPIAFESNSPNSQK